MAERNQHNADAMANTMVPIVAIGDMIFIGLILSMVTAAVNSFNSRIGAKKMPFHPQILDDLMAAGTNIVVDTATAPPQEIVAIVRLWEQGTGNVTIKGAGKLPPAVTVDIARRLGGRVTLEE